MVVFSHPEFGDPRVGVGVLTNASYWKVKGIKNIVFYQMILKHFK